MKAVILAGGRGSRLMPFTEDLPKPLLPVAGSPILDYVTAQLKHYCVEEEILTLGYKAQLICDYVSGYRGIKTRCRTENQPLGTCGSVKHAEKFLGDVFLVLSGDCISDIDLSAMADFHRASGAEVTMAVKEADDASQYGVVKSDDRGLVTRFYEKPGSNAYGNTVNLGVYVVDRKVLSLVPENTAFDFSKDLFPLLMERKTLYSYKHTGYWSDLGSIKSYYETNRLFLSGYKYPYLDAMDATMQLKGTNAVAKSARIYGRAVGSIICGDSVVKRGAQVFDCVVLGGKVSGAHFKRIIKDGIFVDV